MFTTLTRLAVVSLALTGVASADAVDPVQAGWTPMGNGGYCGTVAIPSANPHANERSRNYRAVSKVMFLNRCVSGCTITGSSTANAPLDQSAVQGLNPGQVYGIPEFTNFANETGTAADDEWNQIVACVRETMSYYNIDVVDQRPAAGNYHMAVVAGEDDDIDITSSTGGQLLGISQLACDQPIDNVISFALAEESRKIAGNVSNYVRDVCKTVVHEAGHAYGLEHEFQWLDDLTSACADPMSYDTETCNPSPAYFRNRIANCGEFAQRPCQCPGSANSHRILNEVFGPGQPTVAPPTVTFVTPNAGSLGQAVSVDAGSKRGLARVELYLNGWLWDTKPGAAFARGGGQPNPSPYGFVLPDRVPNGVYDIEVRAYDDLDVMGTSTVTATKGAPCASADSCLDGQKCEEGKCFWDPPTADFGAECTYNEFCLSNMCAGTADTKICTQSCIPGTTDSCPEGLNCIATGANNGICFLPEESGGCCQVNGSGVPWAHAGVSLSILALLMRRRRR